MTVCAFIQSSGCNGFQDLRKEYISDRDDFDLLRKSGRISVAWGAHFSQTISTTCTVSPNVVRFSVKLYHLIYMKTIGTLTHHIVAFIYVSTKCPLVASPRLYKNCVPGFQVTYEVYKRRTKSTQQGTTSCSSNSKRETQPTARFITTKKKVYNAEKITGIPLDRCITF